MTRQCFLEEDATYLNCLLGTHLTCKASGSGAEAVPDENLSEFGRETRLTREKRSELVFGFYAGLVYGLHGNRNE